ncbi:MAG: GTP-binding protein [Gemmatimonadales bacterium]
MHIVIAGHVDHGKSTVIGRLLADTGSLPEGKLAAVRAHCERTARPFEYAFLLDALKDEQAQGITIDTARVFFKSALRDYVIMDAPGHVEFLKNMVTGASHAEAALLVIDAKDGVQENSRRHGFLLGMLGIRQFAVLVNKMDLVDHDKGRFDEVRKEYTGFLNEIGLQATHFIPVAARDGDNLATPSQRLAWYKGPTVLQALDGFTPEAPATAKPFRMPVQDVYKFTEGGDDRRIVAGTISTGRVGLGDEIVFSPSGKKSSVKTIEGFNRPAQSTAVAGMATGFTLDDHIYVVRGEVASLAAEPRPSVTTRLKVSLFWMGREPLVRNKDYLLKIGTARAPMRIEQIHRVLNASTLATTDRQDSIQRHDVAECTLQLSRAVAVDLADDLPATGRFVVVDDFEIRGGGIIREALADPQASARDKVFTRNYKWESSFIPPAERAERYGQKARLVLITGPHEVDRKRVAKELELQLFADDRMVYFLGIGNVLYGVDADLERDTANRAEHIRRLGEVANIMLDAGMIVVASAADLTRDELRLIETSVDADRMLTAWIGDHRTTDFDADLFLDSDDPEGGAEQLLRLLQESGAVDGVSDVS